MPARAPPSMDMLQTVMRPSIESARMAGPAYSITWPAAPETPMRPMVPRIRSLAVTPRPRGPVERDPHRAGPVLGQGLRGQHVLDLAGADAEGERAEGAVRRGVAVAADDGHAGLRDARAPGRSRARCPAAGSRARRAGSRTRRSCAPGPRSAPPRAGPRCRARGRWWARCGRPWPACGPGGARAARPAAGRRRPAARSPRAPGAGPRRGWPGRRRPAGRTSCASQTFSKSVLAMLTPPPPSRARRSPR